MLTNRDIRGVSVMAPTPCVEGGDHWSNTNSVDLEESAHMTEILIRDGAGSLAICGTTGECAGLLWEEKVGFVETVARVNNGRVPVFAGATSLGTKETIRQMRALKDIGAEGAFVGLPLWQTPTIDNSVRWYKDLSDAVPEMGIMVYSNSMFFKSVFPYPLWEGIIKKGAKGVVTVKIASQAITQDLKKILAVAGHQIAFLPGGGVARTYKELGHEYVANGLLRGFWSTSASMGPEPEVALWNAIEKGDDKRVEEIEADRASVPAFMPRRREGEESLFPMLNAPAEKERFNFAGYIKAGPTRRPYSADDLPEEWKASVKANGLGWAQMRKKYIKARV